MFRHTTSRTLILGLAVFLPVADAKKPIVIDCDGVSDDVRAITLALQNPNMEVPVYKGADLPLLRTPIDYSFAKHYFGADGLGDRPKAYPPVLASDFRQHNPNVTAAAALVEIFRKRRNVTLVVTGPLTNVALALRMEPKFARWPTQMIIMGGNVRGVGNIEQTTAESNFYTDPEAAYVVLKNMKCPVTLVTWEACLFAGVKHPVDFYEHLRLNTPLSKFLAMATRAPRAHIANITNPTFPQYFFCDEITIGMVVDAKQTAVDLQIHRASVELRGRIIELTNQMTSHNHSAEGTSGKVGFNGQVFHWYAVASGSFIIISNVLLVCMILTNRRFRSQKEYVVIGANLLFDTLYGTSFFLTAVWNLYLQFSRYSTYFSTLLCALLPYNLLGLFIIPGSGCIVLVTTIDRVTSVLWPFSYSRLRRVHLVALMAVGYALPTPMVAINVAYAANHPNMVPPVCYPTTWGSMDALRYMLYVSAVPTAISVVLYMPIIHRIYMLYKRKAEYAKMSRPERQRILRTTLTFVLIMTSHVGMLMVPDALISHVSPRYIELLVYLRLTKGVVDVLIYFLTQRDLRQALFSGQWRNTTVSEVTRISNEAKTIAAKQTIVG
ncbi:Protein Y43F8C.13 [Aphelenchoides avenae]|nr:Protein Y43F8C.13 [Aphelenchus avenae]